MSSKEEKEKEKVHNRCEREVDKIFSTSAHLITMCLALLRAKLPSTTTKIPKSLGFSKICHSVDVILPENSSSASVVPQDHMALTNLVWEYVFHFT